MKILKSINVLLLAMLLSSCASDNDIFDIVDSIAAPSNISADIIISQDNTGLVTITPNGEGVSQFEIYFNDGTDDHAILSIGESVERIYTEGNYQVKIVGIGLNAESTEVLQPLIVSFLPPENLIITIENDPANNFKINISATADYATMFEVYFGDLVNEEPSSLMPDETISHIYNEVGEYEVKVIARSGVDGAIEITQIVTISDIEVLYELFQDFEGNPPIFTEFGNIGLTQVVSNPDLGGINNTNHTAQLDKAAGSEVWGGTFFELNNQAIDFAGIKKIRLKTYAPFVGKVVKLKLENADASITHEVDMVSTVANSWELLTFDFIDAPEAEYIRVVVFFDFGTIGDGSLYYFDEMEVGEGSLVSTEPSLMIENFEGSPPVFIEFGNIEAPLIIPNFDTSGINNTLTVASQLKTAGSEVWAGSFFEVSPSLDLNAYNNLSVMTYAPVVGAVIKLKLENEDASIVYEVDLESTVLNQWEELVYDFSDAPEADYTRIVIFFDFGNPGNDSVYYYDQFQLTN
jgi:hypothetical protein